MNLFAWILVGIAGVYAAIGIVFALFFVTRGVRRIDPAAVEGTLGFRLLIFPGSVTLWPVLMQRHRERTPPPEERNAHRDLARGRRKGSGDATRRAHSGDIETSPPAESRGTES